MGENNYINICGKSILLILLAIGMAIYTFISGNVMYILFALVLEILAVFVNRNRRLFYNLILFAWFTLELVYFNIMGGTFRIGFLCSIVALFIFIPSVAKIFQAPNLRWMFAFLLYMMVSSCFSSYLGGALKSSLFLTLNASVAFVSCILIVTNCFNEYEFLEIIRKIILFCIVFGLVQWLIYKVSGIGIGVSTSIVVNQLSIGQIPSLRTEANTHGKLVCWAIIFSIPPIVNKYKEEKYRILLILSLVTLALSMTRSATYSMIISIVIMMIWYLIHGKATKVVNIVMIAIVAVGCLIVITNSGLLGESSYSLYKINNLFLTNVDEVKNDGSGGFRYNSFITAFEIWNQSWKTRLIGVGYGQTWANIKGLAGEGRAGATDIMSILAGTGIIGLILFMIFNVSSWIQSGRNSSSQIIEKKVFSEQMLFCSIYGFGICIFSGILQCPEYWLSIGCSAAFYISENED
jgi:hypothetical protein